MSILSKITPRNYIDSNVNISVVEKRAPTDESIKILHEMETAVKKDIIKAISLVDNTFNGVIHHMSDVLTGQTRIAFIFSINGKRCTTNFLFDPSFETKEVWIDQLIQSVAHTISREILQEPFNKVAKDLL